MNVLYARNEFKGVLITCPHCRMSFRHDADDIGDAIKEGKQIGCVACYGRFVLSVTAVIEENVEPAPDAACGHASSDNWKIDERGNMYCAICRAGEA